MKKKTMIHYELSSDKIHEGFLKRPGLFILSKTDHFATPEMNAVVYEKWARDGIPVSY